MSNEEKLKKFSSLDLSSTEAIFEAIGRQAAMLNSAITQLALKSENIANAFAGVTKNLQSSLQIIGEATKFLNKNLSDMAMRRQEWVELLSTRQSHLIELADSLATINKNLQKFSIPIPAIMTELRAIPHKRDVIIENLLAEIELLEKELSKEKAENAKLLAILEEKRKELKKLYVV